MINRQNSRVRARSTIRPLSALLLLGAAAASAALATRAKPSAFTGLKQWLARFVTQWFSRDTRAPLLETESRAGKDLIESSRAPVSSETIDQPVVESEPRSGVRVGSE
jgi:hypothetical protein